MSAKKKFEQPVINTYHRDELMVDAAFTGGLPASQQIASDRRLKRAFGPVSTQAALHCLLR